MQNRDDAALTREDYCNCDAGETGRIHSLYCNSMRCADEDELELIDEDPQTWTYINDPNNDPGPDAPEGIA